ncbi:MAG: GNAT family N-acetyltransferase [Dehalococcoidales bacterium]|jgi:ribosomal protein S18 acetylase RimI-like enzyme
MNKQKPVKITYIHTGEQDLDLIADLWCKLRLHHKERAPEVLKGYFDKVTFDERKSQLLEKSKNGGLLIDLAKDSSTGAVIGYCVSTVNENKHGEIESIFIEEPFRRQHIGDHFMQSALKWMDARSVTRKIIGVGAGNEEVFGFYRRYGFYTRVHILTQVKEKEA